MVPGNVNFKDSFIVPTTPLVFNWRMFERFDINYMNEKRRGEGDTVLCSFSGSTLFSWEYSSTSRGWHMFSFYTITRLLHPPGSCQGLGRKTERADVERASLKSPNRTDMSRFFTLSLTAFWNFLVRLSFKPKFLSVLMRKLIPVRERVFNTPVLPTIKNE